MSSEVTPLFENQEQVATYPTRRKKKDNANIYLIVAVILLVIVFIFVITGTSIGNFTSNSPNNDLGFNITYDANLNNGSCPVVSANEIAISQNLGVKNLREFYPDSITVALSFVNKDVDPCSYVNPSQCLPRTGVKNAMEQTINGDSSITAVISTDFDFTSKPFGGPISFEDVLKFKKPNGKYLVTRLHIGLKKDPKTVNEVEVSLRESIGNVINNNQTPSNNDIVNRINQIIKILNDNGRTKNDMELIISAQGDTCTDEQSSSNDYAFGNIFGPPANGSCVDSSGQTYTVAKYNAYKPYLDSIVQTLKSSNFNIYFASTIYPFYYFDINTDPSYWTQPEDYLALIFRYSQYIKMINNKYGTSFKPMVAETGWPSYCENYGISDKYGMLNPARMRASPCNKCNMWKFFVNPGDTGYTNTTTIKGKKTSVPSNAANGVPRYWWVLSGDATHADCWKNPTTGAPGSAQDSIVFRQNGWNMFNNLGDFMCPYPQSTKISGYGSQGGKLTECMDCPTGAQPDDWKPACCASGNLCPDFNPNTGLQITCCADNNNPNRLCQTYC